ncbi:MAG: CvpA family protein [Cyclobacteriaceae bacterium]|nr:CvpA family protein [Cyclobacteriaceae bacterium]
MSSLDIIILVLMVIGLANGFRSGLILEISGLFGLILAVILGIKWIKPVMGFISGIFTDAGTFLPLISFMIIFVAVLMVTGIIGKFIKKAIKFTPLSFVDNLGGALLGVFKMALSISIFLWIFGFLNISLPEGWISGSRLYGGVSVIAPVCGNVLISIFPGLKEAMSYVQEWIEFTRP